MYGKAPVFTLFVSFQGLFSDLFPDRDTITQPYHPLIHDRRSDHEQKRKFNCFSDGPEFFEL